MQTYTLREIATALGVAPAVVSAFVAGGYVTPERGSKREYRFTFHDLVLLRAARGLQGAGIGARRIRRSLAHLRASLPESMPLASVRLGALGGELVVRAGATPWSAASGQMLFDFEEPLPASAGNVRPLVAPPRHTGDAEVPGAGAAGAAGPAGAADWFARAIDLETTDPAQAERAYRRAIAAGPDRADAYLNLGVLLGEAGRHAEALAVYREGLARCPHEALLHFNLAVALEDAGQSEAALRAYDAALALDATMADAHFNAARLHDQLGRAKQAIRHYSAYRRLHRP